MLSAQELSQLVRTPAYRDFALEGSPTANTADDARRMLVQHQCDTAMLMAYQSLIELFEAYPCVREVRPKWSPIIEDSQLLVLFRVNILTTHNGVDEEGEYRFESYPKPIEHADTAAFDRMVESCEQLYADVWAEFVWQDLNTRTKPYTSAEDVRAAMQEDMGQFLARFEQWHLAQHTQEASAAPARRPGL